MAKNQNKENRCKPASKNVDGENNSYTDVAVTTLMQTRMELICDWLSWAANWEFLQRSWVQHVRAPDVTVIMAQAAVSPAFLAVADVHLSLLGGGMLPSG